MLVKHMKKNIKELIDFDKLRECNTICHKWARRLKIARRDYMKIMHGIYKDKESYKSLIEPKYRSQFTKDCEIMFYAPEVEGLMCEQYSAMVVNIITKKFRINNEELVEQFFTDGMMAIRAATWQYRKHESKATFTTFVHRAIMMRIKGAAIKRSEKIKRRTKRAIVKNFSDYSEDINFDNIAKSYTSENCSYEKQICEIIRDTGLSEQEEFVIRSYMNRKVDCLWYADYVKKYRNEKLNKQFSRQTIYNHLLAVQTKIMKHLKEKNMIDQNFIVPLYRRGDFR